MSIERQLNIDFSGQDNKPSNKFETEAHETQDPEDEVTDLIIDRFVKSIKRPMPRKLTKKDEAPVPSSERESINETSRIAYPDPYSDIYPLSRDLRRQRK